MKKFLGLLMLGQNAAIKMDNNDDAKQTDRKIGMLWFGLITHTIAGRPELWPEMVARHGKDFSRLTGAALPAEKPQDDAVILNMITELVSAKVDPNLRASDLSKHRKDSTALHVAVRASHPDLVYTLLTAKADPNFVQQCPSGKLSNFTPLFQCHGQGSSVIARCLVDHKADINHVAAFQHSDSTWAAFRVLDFRIEQRRFDTLPFLLQHGAISDYPWNVSAVLAMQLRQGREDFMNLGLRRVSEAIVQSLSAFAATNTELSGILVTPAAKNNLTSVQFMFRALMFKTNFHKQALSCKAAARFFGSKVSGGQLQSGKFPSDVFLRLLAGSVLSSAEMGNHFNLDSAGEVVFKRTGPQYLMCIRRLIHSALDHKSSSGPFSGDIARFLQNSLELIDRILKY